MLLLLALPGAVNAQFTYTTNNGAITITGYTGSGGAVTIPSTINELPVTTIGTLAFSHCTKLTGVTIPNSVASIGREAFFQCSSLTNVMIGNSVTNIGISTFAGCVSLTDLAVDALNSIYSSLDGVLFNKSQTTLIQYPARKAGSYTIPNSVTSIGGGAFLRCTSLTSVIIPNSVTGIEDEAFAYCPSLTSVTIGNSVTNIGGFAFVGCTSLTGVYFQGNAPSFSLNGFYKANNATVYYLPGTTGWGTTFAGRPTAVWKPQVQTGDASFGVRTNQFGFNVNWAAARSS